MDTVGKAETSRPVSGGPPRPVIRGNRSTTTSPRQGPLVRGDGWAETSGHFQVPAGDRFEIGKYQRVIAFEIGSPITPTDCRDHVVTDGHRTPDPLRLKPIGDPTGVNARVGGGHDSSGLPKLFGAPSCRGGSAGLKSRGLVTRNGGGARA